MKTHTAAIRTATTSGRVAWKRQGEDRDCGGAAFASVASYHGHHLTVEEARQLVRTDRTGTSMRWICEGARSIGLDARGVRTNYVGLSHLPLPTIVHLHADEGHYLVLTGINARGVRVIDPAVGPMRLRRAEFERMYSGFAIEFRRTDEFVEKTPLFRPVGEAIRLLRSSWKEMTIVVALIAAATALGLLITQQLATAIDAILQDRPANLDRLAVLLLVASTVVSGVQLVRLWLVGRVGQRIERDLGHRFLATIRHASVRDFEERCPVAFGGRIEETAPIRQSLTDSMSQLTGSALVICIVIGVSTVLHPLLGLQQALVVPLMLALSLRTQSVGSLAEFRELHSGYRFITRLIDVFTEFHTIKMFNAEDTSVAELDRRFDVLTDARRQTVIARGMPAVMSGLLVALANTSMVISISWLAASGRLSPGQTILAFGAAGIGFAALAAIPTLLVRWEAASISLERVLEIIHMTKEPNHDRDRQLLANGETSVLPALGVTFDDIDFSYDGVSKVLDGFTASIQPGEVVALVGTTGSGKTSVARLAAALEQPERGSIQIGDLTVGTSHPGDVRDRLAVVFQDTRLLQQSLLANLTLGVDAAGPDDVRLALEQTGLSELVGQQRLGLETHAARAGRNFSSGQSQRFALARALLHNPPVLFLDEATGNIDSAVEYDVLTNVLAARRGRTTIVTAHRFATLRHVDRVLVLQDGKVVEDGPVDELVLSDGPFRRLFAAQLAAVEQ